MPATAVIFDLDDTLIPEENSEQAALLAACALARARFGIPEEELKATVAARAAQLWRTNPVYETSDQIGVSCYEALWGRFDAADEHLGVLRDWVPAFRREVWRGSLSKHGVDDGAFATEIGRAFQAQRRARISSFNDAAPVLADLKKRHRLALLTNGAPSVQREKLDGCGLAVFFELVVISGDIGIGKPDRRVFDHTLKLLKVRAGDAVMVGNSPKRDIAGARNAGVRSVLIRRPGLSSGDGPSPDFVISSLEELPELLR